MNLTKDERLFIRRALGLDRDLVVLKNFYAAHAGREITIGNCLVARGLAKRAAGQQPGLATIGFNITLAGFNAVKKPGERLSERELSLMQWRESIVS